MDMGQIKQNSMSTLAEYGLEVPDTLPEIESLSELSPQSSTACARRAIVLGYMVGFGFKANPQALKDSLDSFGLWESCSEYEKGLFQRELTQQEVVNCTWLTECIQAFAWAFQLADLNHFQHCDDDLSSRFPKPFHDPSSFITEIQLRPIEELFRMADLHYRMHWIAREARLHGQPCQLHEGIIAERRKALDWIIGVEDNWDEMPMDT